MRSYWNSASKKFIRIVHLAVRSSFFQNFGFSGLLEGLKLWTVFKFEFNDLKTDIMIHAQLGRSKSSFPTFWVLAFCEAESENWFYFKFGDLKTYKFGINDQLAHTKRAHFSKMLGFLGLSEGRNFWTNFKFKFDHIKNLHFGINDQLAHTEPTWF